MRDDENDKDIVVEIANNCRQVRFNSGRLTKLVRTVCRRFGLTRVMVSIAVVDDKTLQKINKEFLGRNSKTDVISFDLSDEGTMAKSIEVVVNAERALRQAQSRGHSAQAELALYVVHGLLHNLGFDDSTQKQAQKMHNTEDKILQEFGYGLVYNNGK